MSRLYLVAGIAALSFFTYSQHRGLALYSGDSAVQQSAGQTPSGRGSSSISHK